MNLALLLAGLLALALGVAHSILGEGMVLRKLMRWDGRAGDGGLVLSLQSRRVIRATWHLVTLLGGGIGAMLLLAAWSGGFGQARPALAATFAVAAAFWLTATRGRHPAWVVLGVIAGLVAVG